ncbi:hypothetical protein [Novipirellula artificiosorum]|uniref:Uncharacterized protein n=1 Tax=Novipirellula artificiosorum TaxID=2528016 RepID=A0A5C6D4J4_9BACT|nr:hypothetical protein [Novipirellula artificiosorum]TWU30985.1 hypothetical protein Poly41_64540 [Novipirellula artificiosorum]
MMNKEMSVSSSPTIEIEKLFGQFYDWPAQIPELGEFELVDRVPAPYDTLLDHHNHMTVTVEAYHRQKVDVIVDRAKRDDQWYAREITLVTQQSRLKVLYGMVRLNVNLLSEDAWRRIESQQTPLGRVLIEHDLLCEVELCGLWRVTMGKRLASLMETEIGAQRFGRTALIYCDGDPAIELLEIVSPAQ